MRIFKDYYDLGDNQKFSKYLFYHVNRKNTNLIKKNVGKDYFSRICKNLAETKLGKFQMFVGFLKNLCVFWFFTQAHSLRRSGASLFANAGASPAQLMIWGCWSSLKNQFYRKKKRINFLGLMVK